MKPKNWDKPLTMAEWRAEAERRFGPDPMQWRFICPGCGHVASVADWKAAGANSNHVAFSCVGRWIAGSRRWLGGEGPGPCDYAGGGLFTLNPLRVLASSETDPAEPRFADYFDFAPATITPEQRDATEFRTEFMTTLMGVVKKKSRRKDHAGQ